MMLWMDTSFEVSGGYLNNKAHTYLNFKNLQQFFSVATYTLYNYK